MEGRRKEEEEEDDMKGILRRYLWERESGSVGNTNLFTLHQNRYD